MSSGQSWQTSPELWQKLKPIAKQMRIEPTLAEKELWQRLRNKQTLGYKFRRQHTIERFIVDFYCAEVQLIIEVDSLIHQYSQEQDAIRQEFLESSGFQVLRFSNEQVLNCIDGVLAEIVGCLQKGLTPPPTPSPQAGRGLVE